MNTKELIKLVEGYGYKLQATLMYSGYFSVDLAVNQDIYKPLPKDLYHQLRARHQDVAFHLTGLTGQEPCRSIGYYQLLTIPIEKPIAIMPTVKQMELF